MSFLSQFEISEPLMRWREPNAYSKEDRVTKASSQPPRQTRYKDIESCSVSHESYHAIRFATLTLALKKGLPAGQVTRIALPDDSSLERALQVLRNKGIKIEGHDVPS